MSAKHEQNSIKNVAKDTKCPATSQRLSITPSVRAKIGLGDVSASMAMVQRSTFSPPQVDDSRFVLPQRKSVDESNGDWASTFRVTDRVPLRKAIEASYPYRLYACGVQKHLDCRNGSFDLRAFLDEHATDWAPPPSQIACRETEFGRTVEPAQEGDRDEQSPPLAAGGAGLVLARELAAGG